MRKLSLTYIFLENQAPVADDEEVELFVFRGNQAPVYGDDEAEHLVIYIWGKSGSCDCKLSLCTKKLSNG